MKLFMELRFEQTTVAEIAQRAGNDSQAFFWHLWTVAALVLILGAFLAPAAVIGMSLKVGWRDPRRMRRPNQSRPRQKPAQ
jgi:hypothetical protein